MKSKAGHVPVRTAKVCPKGDKCTNNNCKLSHKTSHFEAVKKKLSRKGKGRGRGKAKGHRRGRAGATIEDEDGGDDYIPYYEIEVDEGDDPVDEDEWGLHPQASGPRGAFEIRTVPLSVQGSGALCGA